MSTLAQQVVVFSATGMDLVKGAIGALEHAMGNFNVLTQSGMKQLDVMAAGAQQTVDVLGKRLTDAAGRAAGLVSALTSGQYERFAEALHGVKQQANFAEGLMQARERVLALQDSLDPARFDEFRGRLQLLNNAFKSGTSTAAAAQDLRNLEQSLGFAEKAQAAAQAIENLKAAVASGEYGKHAAEMARIAKESEGIQKGARYQELLAQFGQFGAVVRVAQGEFQKLADKINASKIALFAVTGSLMGFIHAGLQSTAEGAVLATQFQYISREIASIFLPTIQRVIGALQTVFNWFRSLTGAQQDSIRRWVEAAAVMVVVANLLPRIAGLFVSTLIPAFTAFKTIVVAGSAQIGTALAAATGGLLPLIGVLVTAFAGLLAGTRAGRSVLENLADAFAPLARAVASLFGTLGNLLGPMLEGFVMALTPIVSVFTTVVEMVNLVLSGVAALAGVFGNTFGKAIGLLLGMVAAFALITTVAVPALISALSSLAALFTAVLIPAFISFASTVIAGLAAIGTALGVATGGLSILVGLLVTAIAALGVYFVTSRQGDQEERQRREVSNKGGQFESAADLFKRMNQSAANMGDPAQRERVRQTGILTQIATLMARFTGNHAAAAAIQTTQGFVAD